jgi:tetratricopeptide (TPR) repeat protein
MHDALITELGQLSVLSVISRTSVMQYRNSSKSTPQIARELKVDALVEGSIFKSGEQVRVQVQLVRAMPVERQVWSRTFDGELQDVMVLQKRIARAIAEEMKLTLSPQEAARLAATRRIDPAAYDAWARGWFQFNRISVEAAHKCVENAAKALVMDPSYANAYSLSALCQGLLATLGGGAPDDLHPRAAAAARHALDLDDSLADAHFALAWTLSVYDWDWIAAEREYRSGLALNPGSSLGHARFGWFLSWLNRNEQALAEVTRGAELDPASPDQLQRVSAVHFVARRYDDAIRAARTAIEIDPAFSFGHLRLGQAYMEKGMHELGIRALEKAVELSGNVNHKGSLGRAYAMSGRTKDARRVLEALLSPGEHTNGASLQIAQIYVALGEKEEALRWLERGYRLHDGDMNLLKVFPPWDPLRSDPRFQDLIKRMNFP